MSPAEFARAQLTAWPEGFGLANFRGRRYGVTRSSHAGGRSLKLFARELGGSDFISLNLYDLPSGETALRPCEMPEAKVIDFLREAVPVA